MTDSLVVSEIFLSIQGESTWAGLPCVFVRLAGCNLRCAYCDTAYAFTGGTRQTLGEIRARVHELAQPFAAAPGPQKLPIVELTGGEPLLQPNALPLLQSFCNDGFTVLLETSGALDISLVDPRVHRIMDLKCPGSGEAARNRWANLPHLKRTDEIKFVITTREDYDWAKATIAEQNLASLCPLLFSWAAPLTPEQQDPALRPAATDHTPITRRELAELILADALPVRFQVQLHKFIWPPDQRGV